MEEKQKRIKPERMDYLIKGAEIGKPKEGRRMAMSKLTERAKSVIRKVLAETFFIGVDEGKYSEWDGISTDGLGPDDIPCKTIDPLLNKIVMHLENEGRKKDGRSNR